MNIARSISGAAAMALISLLMSCSQDSPPVQTSEKSARPKELGAIATDGASEEVVLASATLPAPAADAAPPKPAVAETELTLRDANVASELIATHFPVSTWMLRYSGYLSDGHRRLERQHGFMPRLEFNGRSLWILERGDSSVTFELLGTRESELDVSLHVGIDRVVFIHVKECVNGSHRMIPVDEYKIADVDILELFRRCDESAVEHWEREEQFWAELDEIDRRASFIYPLETNRLWQIAVPTTRGVQRPQYPAMPASRFDVWPIPTGNELDETLSHFVGQPLNQMIRELSMTQRPNAPFVSFSNTRGGRWFWISPYYPDHFIEVYFDGPDGSQVVRGIAMRDRETRRNHPPTSVNPPDSGVLNGAIP